MSAHSETLIAQLEEHLQGKLEQGLLRSTDSRRLFHGRGQCYPGLEWLVIDYYAPVLWLTCFSEPEEGFLVNLCDRLKGFIEASEVQALGVSYRFQQGAPSEWLYTSSEFDVEGSMFARRGELKFHIQLGGRQNSGFFLDMEPGRCWMEQQAKGRKVLNLFSYTCAFSVVAAAAGAAEVVNVDMARGALKQGQKNHQLNTDVAEVAHCKTRFLAENILKSWGRIRRPGPYGVLVFDPPSFQRGSFVAKQDYTKLIRRIPQLAEQGADILLCLNAPELGEEFIAGLIAEECPDCVLVGRLEPSKDFPDQNKDQQLKLFHYRYNGEWQNPRS
ncbi:class I SAM-dependent methyltransferase [Pseudoteredinibacter isoporae]|uniref:23S rRNA (Cytosine1962-C5)-methyltransferase n=1 Tax=Pseudoteredinibacter isoporae TaxID=570281 RepID=A0A7X0JXE9_9GAMM|nr:class I SAM-dependent methyltransferase [Pseudoteredinibacter isoporae]MBB6523285.1 23S rRNA (cytosine1962-C5)-methyltransferase [Pseudoteredinibacter isoporae]